MWDQVTSLQPASSIPTLDSLRRRYALTKADSSLSTVGGFAAALPDSESAVTVEGARLKAVLCCEAGQNCEPCLQVIITIRGEDLAQATSRLQSAFVLLLHSCCYLCTCSSTFTLTGNVLFQELIIQSRFLQRLMNLMTRKS